jgi:hypothetical protein
LAGKGNATLEAEIVSPADAAFDMVSTTPAPPQDPNPGTRKLVARLKGKTARTHAPPERVRDMEGAIVNDGFPSSLQTGGCGGSSGAQ